jgi:hypothetical protein
MKELERLIKGRKCHFELYYSSVVDFCMKLYLKAYNDDGSDLVIFSEQDSDLDYLISKCKVVFKDWLLENEGGH